MLDLVYAWTAATRLGLLGQEPVDTVGTIFETTKGPGMKFIWRYVWRKMKEIGNEPEQDIDAPATISSASVRRRDDFESDSGLNMQLYKAVGGRIVSFSHYDRKTDRSSRNVYIITDEQDFERELGKIITLESMRG